MAGGVAGGGDRPKRPVPVEIDGSTKRLQGHRVVEVELSEDQGVIDQAVVEPVAKVIELGDTDRIMDALVGLAKVEPEIARNNLLALAFDSYDANDMVESEKRFRKVLQVDPNHPHSHYLLALIYVNEERTKEAKHHLERFIALAPDDPEAPTATELLKYLNQS